jgi:hypothetical protein
MVYGLWFEPERLMRGATFHQQHPDWVLESGRANDPTLLADFGPPEVQKYSFNIVKGFMELPGFRIYCRDFNMDPLAYWRHPHPFSLSTGARSETSRISAHAFPQELKDVHQTERTGKNLRVCLNGHNSFF